MALTHSTMLELGTVAPDFALPDTANGNAIVRLADFADAPAMLVMFICNHCPYVVHLKTPLAEFAREFAAKGLATVAISANDADNYPNDGPDAMARDADAYSYSFPYLYDEAQSVARAYRAACTPDFFLFGKDRKLAYCGRFDGSTPGNGVEITGGDLRAAVNAVLAGQPAPTEQFPSMGCNIKWKPGNAPDYHR